MIHTGTFRLYAGGNNTATHEWTSIGGKAAEKHWEEVNQKSVEGTERWEGGTAPSKSQGVSSTAKSNVESWTLEALSLPAGATFLKCTAASLHVYNACAKEKDFKLQWSITLEGPSVENAGKVLQWDKTTLTKAEAEAIAGSNLKANRPLTLTSSLASKAEVYCCYVEITVEWEEPEATMSMLV